LLYFETYQLFIARVRSTVTLSQSRMISCLPSGGHWFDLTQGYPLETQPSIERRIQLIGFLLQSHTSYQL
jgi:hypothetical protein